MRGFVTVPQATFLLLTRTPRNGACRPEILELFRVQIAIFFRFLPIQDDPRIQIPDGDAPAPPRLRQPAELPTRRY